MPGTTIGGSAGLEVDDFEDLMIAPPVEPKRELAVRASTPALPVRAGGMDIEGSSMPDSALVSMSARRTLRTVTPFFLVDILALMIAGAAATGALWLVSPAAAQAVGWLAPIALLPLLAFYWLAGLYSEIWVHPVVELRHVVHVNTLALCAAAAGSLLAGPWPVFFAAGWLVAIVLLPMFRVITRHFCAGCRWWGYPTLVIGSGEGIEELTRTILDAPHSGLRPMVLTDPQRQCRSSLLPVVNDHNTLESLVRSEGICHGVVALPDVSQSQLTKMLDHYGELVPHLLVLSDSKTLPTLWGASRSGGRISGIEVRNGLLMVTLGIVKRAIDLAFAIAVFTIGLPIFLGIMAAIRLTSPGPIFFGHTRIGRYGWPFKAWKFRTMYPNSDHMLKEYLASNPDAQAEWDRDQKLRNDPRVTPIGRLLRKTSLDELPQMWNVLRGDMSLVGPRPIVESEVARYGEFYRLYTTVKPGVTGLWQASGRNDIGYEDRVQLDAFYVRHWSPWLDIYIIAKTVVALLSRGGAY
jgi:Undecaprenyl-phosphate galactose phosphotransferase WbaP